MRALDLTREDHLTMKDQGHADAYTNIKQMIIAYDSCGQVDYYKANNLVKDLPNILKGYSQKIS